VEPTASSVRSCLAPAFGSGFGTDTNKVLLIDAPGKVEDLPLMSKYGVAHRILDRVRELLATDRAER